MEDGTVVTPEERIVVNHSRVALVCALGGTYVSLAVIDIDELAVSHFALLNSADFEHPAQAIERYLKSLPSVPSKVGISVAGSVSGDKVAMDHLPWHFDRNDIRAATGADHVSIVNEFDALALALPNLSPYELIQIADGSRTRNSTRLVVAAGTGFGASALTWSGDTRIAVSGPVRHARFTPPPVAGLDLSAVYAAGGPIAAEDVFSGRGLMALYRALAARENGDAALGTPPAVTKAALANEDPCAVEALQLTTLWFGTLLGDLALTFGATGGVFLGGGMFSGVVPVLKGPAFRDAFLGSGARRDYLTPIAINVIKTGADAGLRGAAIALAQSLPARPARATMRA